MGPRASRPPLRLHLDPKLTRDYSRFALMAGETPAVPPTTGRKNLDLTVLCKIKNHDPRKDTKSH